MRSSRFRCTAEYIAAVIAAAAGYFIIYLYTRHGGIGISPDAVTYRSVAQNIYHHWALVDYNSDALIDFPAGYPAFLSVFIFITRLDPLVFAPVLNGLMFATLIYISLRMMDQFIYPSGWYKWTIAGFLIISPCLLEVYSMLWSETLFLLLCLLFMISMRRYLLLHSLPSLLLLSIITALACVTRYAGITLLATGGIFLLLEPAFALRRKIIYLLIFCTAGSSLLILNLVHNILTGGTATGPRERGFTPLMSNMHYLGNVLCDWLPCFSERLGVIVALFFIIALTVVFCARYIRRIHLYTYEHIATGFFIVYTLFMVVISTVSHFEQLNSRLLSPLFIPLLWSTTYWIPAFIRKMASPKRIAAAICAGLLAIAFQVNQLMADYENYDGIKDAGVPGYTEDDWRYSPTVKFLQQHKPWLAEAGTIYSDADDAVWFFTGMHAVLLPRKEDRGKIRDLLNCSHCVIIWFNDAENPDLVSLQTIMERKKIRCLQQFEDGAIYVPDISR